MLLWPLAVLTGDRISEGFYKRIGLFADTAAILISIVSNSYYGMPRGQIHINLPPKNPIMSSETIEIKMAAVSAKRSMYSRFNGPKKVARHKTR